MRLRPNRAGSFCGMSAPTSLSARQLFGHHKGEVSHVAFSPDGNSWFPQRIPARLYFGILAAGVRLKPKRVIMTAGQSDCFLSQRRSAGFGRCKQKDYSVGCSSASPLEGPLAGHDSSVRLVSFRGDGKALISVESGHKALRWDLAKAQLSGHPCAFLTRSPLSAGGWPLVRRRESLGCRHVQQDSSFRCTAARAARRDAGRTYRNCREPRLQRERELPGLGEARIMP